MKWRVGRGLTILELVHNLVVLVSQESDRSA